MPENNLSVEFGTTRIAALDKESAAKEMFGITENPVLTTASVFAVKMVFSSSIFALASRASN